MKRVGHAASGGELSCVEAACVHCGHKLQDVLKTSFDAFSELLATLDDG